MRPSVIRSSVKITLADLKIAKISKKARAQPCTGEMQDYFEALADYGERKMPMRIAKAFVDCMESKREQDGMTTMYHLNSFISRKAK